MSSVILFGILVTSAKKPRSGHSLSLPKLDSHPFLPPGRASSSSRPKNLAEGGELASPHQLRQVGRAAILAAQLESCQWGVKGGIYSMDTPDKLIWTRVEWDPG